MAQIFDQGPPAACPSPFNLTEHVLRAGLKTPDKIALAVVGPAGAERWSQDRLRAAILGTATGLQRAGLAPGDRLLMRLGNTVDFPICFLAAIAIGVLPVPSSPQLTAPEATAQARRIAPAAVVAAPGVALPETDAPVFDLAALRAMRALPPADIEQGPPDRPAYLIFTSGTSGTPQALVHAHRAIWARAMMFDAWYGLRAEDRLLHAGAFNWTYTLGTGLLDPWTVGATALIPAEGVDLAALPLLLMRHDVTIFAGAPGAYRRLLRHWPARALPKLRHGLSAGEQLPASLRAAWSEATGTPLCEAFGMSECSTFLSASPADPGPLRPQPGRRIAITDAAGTPLDGGAGHIAIDGRDPGLMLGPWDPDTEAPAPLPLLGGWFVTADMAEMAPDGSIAYHGRSDDILTAGGYRISPLEIEAVLNAHPEIGESAAVALRVGPETTLVAAFYTAAEPLPKAALEAHTAARLAHYKQPRLYIHRETLPKGANDKLLRRVLRETYEASDG